MNYADRTQKQLARTLAVKKTGKPARTALFLPSHECLCIREALKQGSINKRTRIIAVENGSQATAQSVRWHLTNLGFKNHYVHDGELHNFDLDDVLDGEDLQLAFFDVCGQLTSKLASWFYVECGNAFNPGAAVSFTFNTQIRQNPLFDYWAEGDYRESVKNTESLENTQFHKLPGKSSLSGNAVETHSRLWTLMASNYKFDFTDFCEYADSPQMPMFMVRTKILKRGGNAWARWQIINNAQRIAA